MKFWIVRNDPNLYQIDTRLNDADLVNGTGLLMTYRIGKCHPSQLMPCLLKNSHSDIVFILKIKRQGLVAATRIVDVKITKDIPSEIPYWTGTKIGRDGGWMWEDKEPRMFLEIIAKKIIPDAECENIPSVNRVLHGKNLFGTTFQCSDEDGQLLMRIFSD